jgi:hypothetical protein
MKNKKAFKCGIVAAAVLLTLTTCFSPWNDEQGTIIINLGGGAERSVQSLPEWPPSGQDLSDITHKIILKSDGEESITIERKGVITFRQSVALGIWDITVDAYLDLITNDYPEGKRTHYATGFTQVTVRAGINVPATVIMKQICQECEKIREDTCDCVTGSCADDGHNFPDEWTVVTPATCTEKGQEKRVCRRDNCDETETRDIDIDPDGNCGSAWRLATPTITSLTDIDVIRGCSPDCIGKDENTVTLVEYIQEQDTEPVFLPIDIDLGHMASQESNWTRLLTALYTADKNVALDLSASRRNTSNGDFNTGMGHTATPVPNGMHQIISIVLPNTTIFVIPNYAFQNCTNLRSVTIGNSVTSIGAEAFSRCTGLTEIIIPDSVTTIGMNAFQFSGLTSITIPGSVTSIGRLAFNNSQSLESVIIGDSVNIDDSVTGSIGQQAFQGCTSLKSVTIGNSITSIDQQAFFLCTSLEIVTIGNRVTTIGNWAFQDCTSLTDVTIGNSVETLGTGAFRGCSALTSINISNNVTSIGEQAFQNTGLTDVTIGNSVTRIGTEAFRNTGLKSVIIPDSVITIGAGAFSSCTALESVTIGKGITTIGVSVFYGCTNLTSVTFPNNPGFTTIGDQAFRDCTSLTEIVIPNSVTTIGQDAFRSTGLTEVVIPNSVTDIGQGAFMNCTSLTKIVIPNSVTTIGNIAFSGCLGLTHITFERATPPTFGSSLFVSTPRTLRIIVPADNAAAYRAVTNLSSLSYQIHSVGCDLPNSETGNNCTCL